MSQISRLFRPLRASALGALLFDPSERVFFFEKKNQKTFDRLGASDRGRPRLQTGKSLFASFASEKAERKTRTFLIRSTHAATGVMPVAFASDPSERMFFFGKKNQKTFDRLRASDRESPRLQTGKSLFASFSSRKRRKTCSSLNTSNSIGMALGILALCAATPAARAQVETARNLYTPSLYEGRAFAMQEMGHFPVGPIIPTLYGNPHLFGDWGGVQPWMTNHGIFTSLTLNDEYMGNLTGGRTRDNVNAGQVAGEVDIDWQKLAGIPGFWTHLLVVNGYGRSFSHTLGDSVTNPEQIYGARGNVVAHLVDLYADKAFLNERVIVSLGDIPTGSFFGYDYLACNFMNVSVCSNFAPGKYNVGGRDWPSGNLGGVLRIRPTEQTYLEGGVFAISPHAYNGGISGWAIGQDGMALNRVSSQVEFGWMPEFGHDHLRGNYKIGAWYDNSTYPALFQDANGQSYQASGLPPRQLAGMKTAWFMFDQMLVRNGPGLANGLIVIGGVGYSTGSISAMRDHEWIGLLESGSPWGRKGDQIGIMLQHMQMSRSVALQQESSLALGRSFLSNQWGPVYGVQNWENAYEAFYSLHLVPAASLQADLQYLEHPGASTRFGNAFVMGGQFTVAF